MAQSLREKFRARTSPWVVTYRAGCGHSTENTVVGLKQCLALAPDIIEIDVRKSRDGVLFCRHGSIPFGVAFWQLAPLLPFAWIRKQFPEIPTLGEMVEDIPASAIVCFDVKDARVRPEELRSYAEAFTSVCMMAYSLVHLRALRKYFGENYFYILCVAFRMRGLSEIRQVADMVVLFPWQYRPGTISRVEAAGLMHDVLYALLLPGQRERIARRFRLFPMIELRKVPHTHERPAERH